VKFGRKPKLTPHQQRESIRRRDVDGKTLQAQRATAIKTGCDDVVAC
jgi:hypothetical protein